MSGAMRGVNEKDEIKKLFAKENLKNFNLVVMTKFKCVKI